MTGTTFRAALCAALLTCAAVTNTHATDPAPFDRAIIFGDSLSDSGNLNLATAGANPGPNYVGGVFSNGPVWATQVFGASNLGAIGSINGNVNYAFGGAVTTGGGGNPPSVDEQVGSFAFVNGGTFASNDIVAVWSGANDFLAAGAGAVGAVPTVAAAQQANLNTMIGLGAQNFLLFNLPSLGATPLNNGNPVSAAGGAVVTSTWNAALDGVAKATAAANPGVNVIQVDVGNAFEVVLSRPSAFGITNSTDQ